MSRLCLSLLWFVPARQEVFRVAGPLSGLRGLVTQPGIQTGPVMEGPSDASSFETITSIREIKSFGFGIVC